MDAAILAQSHISRLRSFKCSDALLDNSVRRVALRLHRQGLNALQISQRLEIGYGATKQILNEGVVLFEPKDWRCPECGAKLCVTPCYACEIERELVAS